MGRAKQKMNNATLLLREFAADAPLPLTMSCGGWVGTDELSNCCKEKKIHTDAMYAHAQMR